MRDHGLNIAVVLHLFEGHVIDSFQVHLLYRVVCLTKNLILLLYEASSGNGFVDSSKGALSDLVLLRVVDELLLSCELVVELHLGNIHDSNI